MKTEYIIWTIVSVCALLWYIIITSIVAFRGAKNIKEMLAELKRKHDS
jgi:hypothetical protein